MKHVPNRRDERKTARDGNSGPMKESLQPTAGKLKSLCRDRQWFDCASSGEEASENPRCVRESGASNQGGKARVERPCW